jgi:hypothetical protein
MGSKSISNGCSILGQQNWEMGQLFYGNGAAKRPPLYQLPHFAAPAAITAALKWGTTVVPTPLIFQLFSYIRT